MSLFHVSADANGRHRPGLTDEVVQLLGDTVRGIRCPAPIDPGRRYEDDLAKPPSEDAVCDVLLARRPGGGR
ncbi:hypothetical protein FKN01_04080 [Streptomyces sp. 130]|uniref:hypothetical protein n=1 Tax=Streptomyces sp. 130 TaxID=2591006 RepID=UPI0011800D10|nr:hypothetical protein [Streptomyces sp. 130]TRV80934.1 hypothetical protein FKN01_04080 [Streptomyces sp. 130]